MGKLERLKASYTNFSDLPPLATISSLNSISLGGNKISDLAPLKHLPYVETLDLPGILIENVTVIVGYKNLRNLDLSRNPLKPGSALPQVTDKGKLRPPNSFKAEMAPSN